jgi:hypothetical protein
MTAKMSVIVNPKVYALFMPREPTSGPGLSHYRGFKITLGHTALDLTPLCE